MRLAPGSGLAPGHACEGRLGLTSRRPA
jgi:hypothetical protein